MLTHHHFYLWLRFYVVYKCQFVLWLFWHKTERKMDMLMLLNSWTVHTKSCLCKKSSKCGWFADFNMLQGPQQAHWISLQTKSGTQLCNRNLLKCIYLIAVLRLRTYSSRAINRNFFRINKFETIYFYVQVSMIPSPILLDQCFVIVITCFVPKKQNI